MFRLTALFSLLCIPLPALQLFTDLPLNLHLPEAFKLEKDARIENGAFICCNKGTRIFVRFSDTVKQTGENSLEGDAAMKKELKRLGGARLTQKKLAFGPYPVFALEAVSLQHHKTYAAWIGLNRPDRLTLFMALIPEDPENGPTPKEERLWQELLLHSS